LFSYADNIVVLKDGRITDTGSFSQLQAKGETSLVGNSPSTGLECDINDFSEKQRGSLQEIPLPPPVVDMTEEETRDYSRRDGEWSVYRYYARKASYGFFALFVLMIMTSSFTTNFSSKFYFTSLAASKE
jgi:ATP-binding cassette subfamily C (CFTR/MRP) protein 1